MPITLEEAFRYMLFTLCIDPGLAEEIILDDRLLILPEELKGKVCVDKDNLEFLIKEYTKSQ